MILAALVLLSSPGVETNIVNQANPSTSIYCPLFVTRGEAVFGGPDVKPRGHNKTLQRHMCFSYIVRPLHDRNILLLLCLECSCRVLLTLFLRSAPGHSSC